jgi:hypothetical protein
MLSKLAYFSIVCRLIPEKYWFMVQMVQMVQKSKIVFLYAPFILTFIHALFKKIKHKYFERPRHVHCNNYVDYYIWPQLS